jgi:hypothetical protein
MIKQREPSAEEITRQAHELYVQRGERREDVEDWVAAEKDLTEKSLFGAAKTRAA